MFQIYKYPSSEKSPLRNNVSLDYGFNKIKIQETVIKIHVGKSALMI